MSSDADDMRILDPQEVQDIIEWAISAAALVLLMDNSPEHESVKELEENMEGFREALKLILVDMPEPLQDPAVERANGAYIAAEEDEEIVEKFVELLNDDDFLNRLQEG